MFNLIITIISITLVVAMAAASVYYGGTAFTNGSAKANAATLVTQAQQINGALTMYSNSHGGTPTSVIGDLVGEYLQSAPAPGSAAAEGAAWSIATGNSVITGVSPAACLQVAIGSSQVPASTSVVPAAADVAALSALTVPYACAVLGSDATGTMVYTN